MRYSESGQWDSNTPKMHDLSREIISTNNTPSEPLDYDTNKAAMEHFNRSGYNKGTAGDMLKASKSRLAESVAAAGNIKARKASKTRTADREEARRQERGE
jgi:hypothetical protein